MVGTVKRYVFMPTRNLLEMAKLFLSLRCRIIHELTLTHHRVMLQLYRKQDEGIGEANRDGKLFRVK